MPVGIDIAHVARLARLQLDDTELEIFAEQLATVVAHIETLQELDTDEIEPLVHALEQSNVLRPDEIRTGLSTAAALANAPQQDGGFFLVPAVLE